MRGTVVSVAAVDPVNLLIFLGVAAAFLIAAAALIRALEQRDKKALETQVLALWEALALARQDLRLEVNERGERTLHGTVRSQRYTVSVMSPGRGWAHMLAAQAKIQREPAPRMVVWPSGELPAWAPRLPRTVRTGHEEFDEFFTVYTDDEALALSALDVDVREAMLGIPGSSMVCDEGRLTLITGLGEAQVDAEFIDQVRAVVAGVCASGDVATTGN